jgi:hypothetical protein
MPLTGLHVPTGLVKTIHSKDTTKIKEEQKETWRPFERMSLQVRGISFDDQDKERPTYK